MERALKNLTENYSPILEKNSTTGTNDTAILNAFSWKEKKYTKSETSKL